MKVSIKLSAALLGALALVSLAGAATVTPSAARMTLAPADVAGAKVVSQGKLTRAGYLATYQRTLRFATRTAAPGSSASARRGCSPGRPSRSLPTWR